MRRALIVFVVASATAGAALGLKVGGGASDEVEPGADGAARNSVYVAGREDDAAAAIERLAAGAKIRAGTRRTVGAFRLGTGRTVELATAETMDGQSCLLDEDPVRGSGGACDEDGLFAVSKVAFSINSDGGPDRFAELYLPGIAASDVTRVVVLRSDGSSKQVVLNRERAFLYESTPAELKKDVVPAGLRLFGRGGKLVETVDIPSVR